MIVQSVAKRLSIAMAKIHEKKCEKCQNTFQNTNELKMHTDVCPLETPKSIVKQKRQTEKKGDQPVVTPPRKNLNCDSCNYKANADNELENHNRREHLLSLSPDPKRLKLDMSNQLRKHWTG